MKRYALAALALLGTLGLGSVVSARDALFEEENVSVDATFYSGNPEGDAIWLNEATLNNSPGAVSIANIESATYVILEYEGDAYGFEVAASGENKNTVELFVGAEAGETMTLDAVVDGLVENPSLLEQLSS